MIFDEYELFIFWANLGPKGAYLGYLGTIFMVI